MKKFLLSLLAVFPLFLVGCQESESIGIIGGADGPTAIFVTTSPDKLIWDLVILLILFAVVVFWIIWRRKKRK